MTKQGSTLKSEALHHINAALNVKFRDDALRAALHAAAALAQPQTNAGRSRLEHENLAPGGKLTCKANPGLLMRHGGRTGKVWFFRYRDNQGMEKEKRVGTYPDMSLVDARKQVQDLRERRVSGKPLVGTFTFTVADLCEKFIEEHAHGTKSNAEPVTTSLRGISIDQASTLTTLPWSVLPMTGSMRMPSTGQPFS